MFLCLCSLIAFNKNELLAQLDTVDIEKPKINYFINCSRINIQVVDSLAYQIDEVAYQKDAGVITKPNLILSSCENVSEIVLLNNFREGEPNFIFNFFIDIIDPYQDARASFYVIDDSKNSNNTVKEIIYIADKLRFNKGRLVDFGKVRLDKKKELTIELENLDNQKITNIDTIYLQKNRDFNIEVGKNFGSITPNQVRELVISFSPNEELTLANPYIEDTLVVKTNNSCLTFKYPMRGQGVIPKIRVSDFDFNTVFVDEEKCMGELKLPDKSITIKNYGSSDLTLTGMEYDEVMFQFSYSLPELKFPIVLKPGEVYNIEDICVRTTIAGEDEINLIFHNDAYGADSIAKLRTIGMEKGPYITTHDFNRVRLGDRDTAFVYVRNNGINPVSLRDILIEGQEDDLEILFDQAEPKFSKDRPIEIYPTSYMGIDITYEVKIPIVFNPHVDYRHSYKIIPTFSKESNIQIGDIYNYIYGTGFLPRLEGNNYEFKPKVLTNTYHKDTAKIIIKSASITEPLIIHKANLSYDYPEWHNSFELLNPIEEDTTLYFGEELEFQIRFRPHSQGVFRALLNVRSNSYYGGKGLSTHDTSFVILGEGYNKILVTENLDFGNIPKCSQETKMLTILNQSDTLSTTISGVDYVSGDNSFEFDKSMLTGQKLILAPGERINLPVTYIPIQDIDKMSEATFLFHADNDTVYARLYGENYKNKINLSLDTNYNVQAGDLFSGISLRIANENIHQAEIDEFKIVISYDPRYLRYNDFIYRGEILSNWGLINAKEELHRKDYATLELRCFSDAILRDDGVLLSPEFKILLSDSNKTSIHIESASFGDSDMCMENEYNSGYLTIYACGGDMRNVLISTQEYFLNAESTSNSISINAGIGLDANTQIILHNSNGKPIRTVYNNYIQSGEYSFDVSTFDISSGVYFITIDSGPYQTTRKVSVVK